MDPPQEFKPVQYFRKLTITYDILLSDEFRSLTGAARDVYIIFLYKRQFCKKKQFKPSKLKNNCEIQFTEDEAIKKWEIGTKKTFWRAIKQLKDRKMIRIAHKGFGFTNDVNLYELLGKFDGICDFRKY